MDTLRSVCINASYKVLVDILSHERDHRSCSLGNCYQCCVKCHVSIDLILLHALCPKTLTASSYIPVTHIVNKFLECSCSLRNLVGIKIRIDSLHHGIQLAEQPFIHNRKLIVI